MVTGELVGEATLNANLVKRISESELYSRKFGSFSKSDYEVLMFTAYLDSLQRPARDYELSIALGITETKVRNLRIKSQLLYPRELKWVDELSASIRHGYYDKISKQITVSFEDPSVRSLIKNKIEEGFGTVGFSLNTKQLILPIESFLLLAALAEDDENSTIEQLNKAVQAESSLQLRFEKKKFNEKILKDIPDMLSLLNTLISIYSGGRPIVEALASLIG
jgi:hypothetical protein